MATHTATPHGNAANPQEDIGAVLERFEQWSGKQRRPAAAAEADASSTRSQRTAHLAYSTSHQMTRELSYEEALSRARSRSPRKWDDDSEAMLPPAKAVETAMAGEKQTAKASDISPKTSSATTSTTHAPQAAAKGKSTAKRSSQTSTRIPKNSVQAPDLNDGRKTRTAAGGMKTKSVKSSSKTKKAATKTGARKAAASENVTQSVTYESIDSVPQPAASFRQVLSAQMHGTTSALVPEALAEPVPLHVEEISGTSVSVVVHLPVTERNALRLRAQQLGLTADAYLRQCALEVESLRSELQEILVTRMQAARQLPAQPRRDWLERLKQYFFPQRTDCQTQIFHA